MRPFAITKIAQVLTTLIILSLLVPLIAFGANVGIKSQSYDKTTGTVSASVYSDVYSGTPASLEVFAPDGTSLGTTVSGNTYTTKETVGSVTYYYYSLSKTIAANVYDAVYLRGSYNGTVTDRVYVNANPVVPPCTSYCGGGGGWGGGYVPPVSGPGITVPASGEVNADSLKKALAADTNVQLTLAGDKALIPASALVDAIGKPGAAITVVSDNGTYILPLSVLKLDALAAALGINIADLKIQVSITKLSGDSAKAVVDAAKALGGTPLADAVDFKVVAVGKDGKTADIDFGNTYVSRTLKVSKAVDTKKVTGVLYDDVTKKLRFVPATFATNDGKTVATLKRNGNSIYTVVEFDKSFADVASHWSKNDVTLLANKLVVDGVTNNSFDPDRSITRAEFAALVVRSLGLDVSVSSSVYFKDVASSDWYAGVVAAAVGAKIINGYEDGSFKPNAPISREELAAMVVRAMRYAGANTDLSASNQAMLLAKFADSNQIVWAQKEIAVAIDAGVINGLTDTTIGSKKQATRAESATMLKRFLTKANFIN